MPEPTDPFTHFDPEVPVPLPAADIRRRGDRLRRRNTGLAIAGGVAAVALIAAPLAVLTGGDERAQDPAVPVPAVVTPSPGTAALVSTIPDDFPLASGYPGTNEDRSSVSVLPDVATTEFDLCGTGFSPAVDALTDTAVVGLSGAEDSRERMLTVWADVPSATAALVTARDALAGCAEDGFVTTERETSYDTEAVAFTEQAGPEVDPNALGLGVYEVVRVRNAVYLSYDYGEGGGTAAAARAGVAAAFDASSPVVGAMYDVFAGGSGGLTEPPPSGPGAASDDLSSFPLASGWPDPASVEPGEPGLQGPAPDLEPIDYRVCDTPLPVPTTTGDLRALYGNVEDSRSRRLLTFATADEAVSFMDSARAFNEACTEYPPSEVDDTVLINETVDTALGGQSFAAYYSTETSGEPAIGLRVSQFVRLGRAVLIDTAYGEGIRSSAPGVLEGMVRATAGVVSAMCAFTEAGC
jgi:hypothetical protein